MSARKTCSERMTWLKQHGCEALAGLLHCSAAEVDAALSAIYSVRSLAAREPETAIEVTCPGCRVVVVLLPSQIATKSRDAGARLNCGACGTAVLYVGADAARVERLESRS